MRFTINLTTRTYLDHTLLNKYIYSTIVVLLVVTAWNVNRVSSYLGEQSRLNSEITAIQARLGIKPGGLSESEVTGQKAHIRFYNGVIERKSIDWLSMLELIENSTPVGVSLSALSPAKIRDEWKLEGRAKTFKTVQQYLEKLEASKSFTNVMLLSHQNISAGEKVRGVQFTISCKVVR